MTVETEGEKKSRDPEPGRGPPPSPPPCWNGTRPRRPHAAAVADALVLAEADGLSSHGLSRLAAYADQAAAGKVDGFARPVVSRPRPAALTVDALTGFAFPALETGLRALADPARDTGVAPSAVANSHHFGVAGHPVEAAGTERAGRDRLRQLAGGDRPGGGARPVFGTKPDRLRLSPSRRGRSPIIDPQPQQGLPRQGDGRRPAGRAYPEGWALDAHAIRPPTRRPRLPAPWCRWATPRERRWC